MISGSDMTPEAALTKLAYVLSKNDWDIEKKRKMMQTNLRGELTPRQPPCIDKLNLVNAVATSLNLSSKAEFQELSSILFPAILNAAVLKCDITELESLLNEYGADISQKNVDGRTTLHVACSKGNLTIVQRLLTFGANVHARDRFDHTPLIDAIDCNHHDIIHILLKYGAKLDEDNDVLGNEMCRAAAAGNEERLTSFLIAGANVSQKDASGRTPLHLAALHNNVSVLKLLLNHGANPTCTDMIGHTPFDLAKLVGATKAMECLSLTTNNLAINNKFINN